MKTNLDLLICSPESRLGFVSESVDSQSYREASVYKSSIKKYTDLILKKLQLHRRCYRKLDFWHCFVIAERHLTTQSKDSHLRVYNQEVVA